jgi:hypothetical protein
MPGRAGRGLENPVDQVEKASLRRKIEIAELLIFIIFGDSEGGFFENRYSSEVL